MLLLRYKNKFHQRNTSIQKTNTSILAEINSNTVTPLTSKNRSFTQKINKGTQTLNDKLDQSDLTDICKVFHPKTVYSTFVSSSAHGMLFRIDYILGHKSSLGKVLNN